MRVVLFALILLVIGFSSGFFINSRQVVEKKTAACQKTFKYINTFLGCRPTAAVRKHEYTDLVDRLNTYIDQEKAEQKVTHVSVYFRDLHYGPTFGISDQSRFSPASLLKLPLLMTYLSLAEDDEKLLKKKITYVGDADILEQTSSSSSSLEANKQYTIEYLLSRMIIDSDNLAYVILFNSLKDLAPANTYQNTLLELGLINPRTPTEDTITVKSYASLFRHLYTSSYLSPEMSEKALTLLSQSSYAKGLAAGLPKGTPIAHKFGERAGLPDGQKQLHDCGIVYYPENPYLLCVMTRGEDFASLESIIQSVSEQVYKEFKSRSY